MFVAEQPHALRRERLADLHIDAAVGELPGAAHGVGLVRSVRAVVDVRRVVVVALARPQVHQNVLLRRRPARQRVRRKIAPLHPELRPRA